MSDETVSGVRLEGLSLERRYKTPLDAPVDYICRRVSIPNDLAILAAIDELIGLATNPDVWDDTDGLTALEASALVAEVYLWSDCMIGAIMPYIGDNPPPGMLAMDGSIYDGEDYPKLYEKIPATWKLTGTEFYLPDMADYMVMGAGNTYAPYSNGGEAEHTLTTDEMPEHSHTTQPHNHGYSSPVTTPDALGELPTASVTSSIPAVTTDSAVTVNTTGGGLPHNNLPPYRAFKFGMVAK